MSESADHTLHTLLGSSFQVFYSEGAGAQAEDIRRRVGRAEAFLSRTLEMSPTFVVKVLNPQDWDEHTTDRPFGMPHALNGELVLGTEPAAFWRELGVLFSPLSGPDRARLTDVYGEPPSFARFADFLAVHELGHLYHPRSSIRFPRLWLKEFFANLCMYAYSAVEEPDSLELISVGPELLTQSPAMPSHRSLADFERLYSGVGAVNYCWYQFRLSALAEVLFKAAGVGALQALHQAFRGAPEEFSDPELADRLTAVHPVLAAAARDWPA